MIDMLSSIPSPTGGEEVMIKFLKKLIDAETYEDSIGNLIVHIKGEGKKVMLICGIDEDCVIALNQDCRKVNFNHIGNKKLFPGTLVNLGGNEGYVCSDNMENPTKDQYIKLINDAEIQISTSGIIVSDYFEDEFYIKGSRIGRVCVLNEMINLANNYSGDLDLYIVFEVQSLFGHKGAIVASNNIEPDYIIAFEEIESDAKKILNIKAARAFVSSEVPEEFIPDTISESYVNTELDTTATYIKNSVTVLFGVPVDFYHFSSSRVLTDVKNEIM